MKHELVIKERDLSVAWARAFLKVMEQNEVTPLVLVLENLDDGGALETESIRQDLDQYLESTGNGNCRTVANTIFPSGMWNPGVDREELFKRYLQMLPRLRKHQGNRNGLYFERLIAYGSTAGQSNGKNQLDHVIRTWASGNNRRSALQAAVFDPLQDHTNQPRRGFPCLLQLAFDPQDSHGLAVTGIYVTQYMFDRAYGNLLGLVRLGEFMAHEMGLTLTKLTCVATRALLGNVTKSRVRPLADAIEHTLLEYSAGEPHA